jgi:GntR family transcriptional regulator
MDGQGSSTTDVMTATVRAARDRVRELIGTGAFAATGRLPSERELVASLAVSRTTLRRALTSLADEGVVSAAPKSGWFVSGAPLSEPSRTLVSFTEMARRRGVEPRTRVIAHRVRDATIDESAELVTAPLSPVLEVERLRLLGDVPACIDRSVILLSRTPGIDGVSLENTSLYEQMRSLGTDPTRSRYGVEAVGAVDRDAELLDIPVGSPILLAAETCYDAVGRALLIGETRYRAGIYRFYTTMLRR